VLASTPTFLLLKERACPAVAQPGRHAEGAWRESWSRVAVTFREAARFRDLRRLLLCILLYQAGIQTVIALAAIFAQQALGFSSQDTIILVLVVNVTAALGAFAFGQVQDRLGHVPTMALTLVGWIIMTLMAWQTETRAGFWVAANIAGVCLGSSQSAGRAVVAYLCPPGRHAEFFGLWGLAVKLSSILGPLTYGTVTWASGGDHRLAMLVTGLFFAAGLAMLFGIDVERGRRAALSAGTLE
jgi:UMF1 family MFS transporter